MLIWKWKICAKQTIILIELDTQNMNIIMVHVWRVKFRIL